MPEQPETTPAPTSSEPAPSRFHARTLSDGRRVYWWVELIVIAAFYLVYSAIRNSNEGGELEAFRNARSLIDWEQALGLYFEQDWQQWALNSKAFTVAMNYFYGSLHFVITAGAIVFLFRRHTNDYPRWRNTLAITTGLALVGFILWPLMPPRLLPEAYGYVDTLARYPTFWSFESGAVQSVSNQYAAMPSLHFAWALFCAASLVPRVSGRWLKWSLGLYPVVTLVAIVVTANHFWLDAVGGAAIFGLGWVLARRFTRAGRSGRPTDEPAGESLDRAPAARAGARDQLAGPVQSTRFSKT